MKVSDINGYRLVHCFSHNVYAMIRCLVMSIYLAGPQAIDEGLILFRCEPLSYLRTIAQVEKKIPE